MLPNKSARLCLNLSADTVIQILKGGKQEVTLFMLRQENFPIYSRYSVLCTVESILSNGYHGNDDYHRIFKHNGILRRIFPGFMWDPNRITLELSKDPNVIRLAS